MPPHYSKCVENRQKTAYQDVQLAEQADSAVDQIFSDSLFGDIADTHMNLNT